MCQATQAVVVTWWSRFPQLISGVLVMVHAAAFAGTISGDYVRAVSMNPGTYINVRCTVHGAEKYSGQFVPYADGEFLEFMFANISIAHLSLMTQQWWFSLVEPARKRSIIILL